jgi:hypothetical protein
VVELGRQRQRDADVEPLLEQRADAPVGVDSAAQAALPQDVVVS